MYVDYVYSPSQNDLFYISTSPKFSLFVIPIIENEAYILLIWIFLGSMNIDFLIKKTNSH